MIITKICGSSGGSVTGSAGANVEEFTYDKGIAEQAENSNLYVYRIGEYNNETNKFEYVDELKQWGYEGQVKINTYYQYMELGKKLIANPIKSIEAYSGKYGR